MRSFDIHEIAAVSKTDEENKNALEYFHEIAFSKIAAGEIGSILREHKGNWQSVFVRQGKNTDKFEYPDKIIKEANGDRENIISLVITGTSRSIQFIYELKEYANDFSFTSAYALPDEKVIYILFFVR